MKSKLTFLFIIILTFFSCNKSNNIELYGDIYGIITDATSNQPLQGVIVSLSPVNSSQTTGSDGKYEFKSLDAVEYTIQAVKSGYKTNTKTFTVIAGELTKGDFALLPIIPILGVSVTSLDFGANLTSLPVAITNTGEGTLDWSVSENSDWISVNPLNGSTTTQTSNIIITVDRSVLSPGTYSQVVTLISNGGNATITINITK